MKVSTHTVPQNEASTLLVALMFSGIMAIVLASVLYVAGGRNTFSHRSTAWNDAIPIAEAGIEEALTQIHYSTTNLTTNGWSLSTGGYSRSRSLDEGYYTVTIQPTIPPIIVSTGYVRAPLETNFIQRTVKVTTGRRASYGYGILAKDFISMSGGSYVDSFNSSDPNCSTAGQYDQSKRQANVKVATNSGGSRKVSMSGSATIFGYVATGPNGTVNAGGGPIGDLGWAANSANKGKIQPGHMSDDVNEPMPDVTPPYSTGITPTSGKVGATNYNFVLGSGNYYYKGSMTIPGGGKMVITGDATLYVTGTFTISGSGFAYLMPGASLRLYIGGDNSVISGGGIANTPGFASNLSIFCLPAVTKFTYSGSSQFVGTLYAPQAATTISGSSYAVGSFVAYNFTLSGGMNVHYDEGLSGPAKYFVTSWREL